MLKPFESLSKESKECAACHKKENPGLYNQWGDSKHYGANVGCYECHGAKKGEPDAFEHEGFIISNIVSPLDCGQCHKKEQEEMDKSHHATAGQIIGSLDNTLAEVIEGATMMGKVGATLNGASPAALAGCWQCHGSQIKVLGNGELDPATWPNTGIGRINPDGSKGTCIACHNRHEFSIEQVRAPETCGKCHLGPDHPQKEIYEESKHGIAYYSRTGEMNMSSEKWIVGEDYDAAPTCATCHMSATSELPVTHDVGDRISWTLRPAISEKVDAAAKAKGKQVKPWEERRKDMQNVCGACHTKPMVENFYKQFDSVVNLYNEKFAKPGKAMITLLKKEGLITPQGFDEEIEWTWFYLWHHQGRRARHGAAMMAPDYTQWHGMFEVAEAFYKEMIPQYQEIVEKAKKEGKVEAAEKAEKLLEEILARPEHAWFTGNEPEEVKKARLEAQKAFKSRYLNDSK